MTYRTNLLAAIPCYLCLIFGISGCHEQASTPLAQDAGLDNEHPMGSIASRRRARKSASHSEQDYDGLVPASVLGLNYSAYYIVGFSVTDTHGRSGGGPSIHPSKGGSKPAGGDVEQCCLMIPQTWTAGTTVTVSWQRRTDPRGQEDPASDQWFTAVAKVPPHGRDTYGFWVYFLDGDRIKVQVGDGTVHGKPLPNDAYIAHGLADEKLNGARHR
ncbi:DUF3304 domain-containing protein [Burkholderia sp. L27(2015)]|uniref:DUF3304 domain-containing protein n=1 Tax=Burkholderia sp. L27(2015) TaxID=1641858 RepID=UPI00131CF29B|nr:DUF3304 domain-containing protein [Burkholderia sp. L27(2015)]